MNVAGSYNEAVRRRFAQPSHAGDLSESFERTLVADVADSDKGSHVVMAAGVRDGVIAEIAFRAWGCPHLIAALEAVSERLEGEPLASLENCDLEDITQELAVPAEKMGRILLLEDALATLWARHADAAT